MRQLNSNTEREKLIIELSKNGGPLMFMTSEVVDLIIAERQRIMALINGKGYASNCKCASCSNISKEIGIQ